MLTKTIVHGIEVDYSKDELLTTYARDMLMEFYSLPGEKSPQDLYARACRAWSTYHGVTDFALGQRLYSYVSNRWFMFASPVLSNAPLPGSKSKGLPISCFLGYVPDTIAGLINHTSELRWLSVMGGGVGGHWSDVRSISDVSPGPIPFIHTVDADMTAYKQGKTRKGSYAAYLDVDHPDIIEFIQIRVPTGDDNRKSFNIHNAVNIKDSFMEAVIAGNDYELIDPKKGATGTFLNARAVWQKLLEIRFRTGEPYLNFIDTANRWLPEQQKALGLRIYGSNLCDEIHLATNEERTAVCCLSSPNIEFYDEYKHTTMIQDLTVMLDNVLEYFIQNAPPELARTVFSTVRERSIGIGGMGFHSYLQRNDIAFESIEAIVANESIFEHHKSEFLIATLALGTVRGEAPDMQGTGRRNAHGLAIAPNASSGIIVGASPSIEPNKANAYTHRTRAGSFLVTNVYLKELLRSLHKDTPDVWSDIITNKGSIQHLEFLTDHQKEVFKTSFELNQHWIIQHAADRQPYVCQGQSVNLFFLPGAQRKYVREVHEAAWQRGLKGLYYLRSESKQRAEKVSGQLEEDKLTDNTDTIVYGKENCPYCNMAKQLLDSKGIEYEYVDIVEQGKTAAEVTGRPGVRTLPQIYLYGKYVGGFQELYKELTTKPDGLEEGVSDDECKACEG